MSAPRPEPAGARLPPLRRNRAFQLLWSAATVSQLGTEVTRIATPLLVLALTGSPGWAGVVAGAGAAGLMLAQVPAGAWVDRWDRRRTLLCSVALRALTATALAALVATGLVQVWHLVALAVVDGVCAAFAVPARMTAVRAVVPGPQLGTAYTQEESRLHAARLVGPPLGGLLYGFGRAVPFVADALTFVVATVCVLAAKVPRRPAGEPAPPRARGLRREAGEAVAWFWGQRGLREVTAAAMVLNLLGGAFLLPLIVLVGDRGGDALVTGTVLAAAGVGGLVGALLSGRMMRLLPPGRLLVAVVAVFGCALVAMALPLGPWWPMVPLTVVTLSTPAVNVVLNVVVARLTPQGLLGRVDAVLTVASRGLSPFGPVLGGGLAALLGGAGALVLLGVLLLVTAAGAASSRELRRFTGQV